MAACGRRSAKWRRPSPGPRREADYGHRRAMLDEFEHRVDAMLEIAGGRPEPAAAVPSDVATTPSANEAARTQDTQGEDAPAAQAEITETLAAPTAASDQVPTVSSMSAAGRSAPERLRARSRRRGGFAADESAGDKGPTVAMLTAMVRSIERLHPERPEPEPQAAAEFAPPATGTAACRRVRPARTRTRSRWPRPRRPHRNRWL